MKERKLIKDIDWEWTPPVRVPKEGRWVYRAVPIHLKKQAYLRFDACFHYTGLTKRYSEAFLIAAIGIPLCLNAETRRKIFHLYYNAILSEYPDAVFWRDNSCGSKVIIDRFEIENGLYL